MDSTFLLLDWIHDSTGEIGTLLADGFQKPLIKNNWISSVCHINFEYFLIICNIALVEVNQALIAWSFIDPVGRPTCLFVLENSRNLYTRPFPLRRLQISVLVIVCVVLTYTQTHKLSSPSPKSSPPGPKTKSNKSKIKIQVQLGLG